MWIDAPTPEGIHGNRFSATYHERIREIRHKANIYPRGENEAQFYNGHRQSPRFKLQINKGFMSSKLSYSV